MCPNMQETRRGETAKLARRPTADKSHGTTDSPEITARLTRTLPSKFDLKEVNLTIESDVCKT